MRQTTVYIVQPVIPHYRLGLFNALAGIDRFDVKVHASQNIPGAPSSVPDLPAWGDASHECLDLFGRRLFWQRGLTLPIDLGQGDVLILNGNPRFLSNIPLALCARRRRAGIIWWGHGWSSTSKPWRAAIRYRLMGVADVVLLYTEDEVRALSTEVVTNRTVLALNNTLDAAPIDREIVVYTGGTTAKTEEH